MAEFSIWSWLIVLVVALAMVIPFWRILPRAGVPAAVSLVALIPFGALILLWILAFKRWPRDN